MMASSAIQTQERKIFHLSPFKHLNVDLKIGLFLLQWIWFCFLLKLQKSTSCFLEFYKVKARSLFHVLFMGYIAEVEG